MRKISVAMLCVVVAASGCGKKSMQEPPPVATPEPVTTAPTPAPPPRPEPTPAPAPRVELADVYFDYDSAELRADARTTLTENGRQLVASTGTTILIEGHCDERGTVDYNLALGERRAVAAKSFLESYGVDGSRMQTVSYGENRPLSPGHDEAAWAQNRRAHFVVEGR